MIEIVTLFLGLVTGPQAVELAVNGPATVVEVRLDGELVERLTSPPWRLEIDLGETLVPHEIVAVARDQIGRELARVQRWVNMDMPRSEVDRRAPGGVVTPLPVVFGPEGVPAADEMGAWFLADGRPLTVNGMRAGPAEVVVVQHPSARPVLEEMARVFLGHQLDRLGIPAEPPPGDSPAWSPELLRMLPEEFQHAALEVFDVPDGAPESGRIGSLWRFYNGLAGLGDETEVRFVLPLAAPVSRSTGSRHLFAASESVANAGLLWLAKEVRPLGFTQRVADAVAIAGREVHATGRRRAVVLLLNGETSDDSLYEVAAVRDYLRALRVPLFTWTLSPAATPTAWGEASFIGLKGSARGGALRPIDVDAALDRLCEAAAEVRRELEHQRIVLLRGEHLLHRIGLATAAAGSRPAGLEPLGGEPPGPTEGCRWSSS